MSSKAPPALYIALYIAIEVDNNDMLINSKQKVKEKLSR